STWASRRRASSRRGRPGAARGWTAEATRRAAVAAAAAVTPGAGDAPLARLRALLLDPRAHAVLLTACAALVILARAGAGPLANYDAAYYAEKAKQMLRAGDWLTPRFAGIEGLDNPPLFLWLMAGSFAVLGVNEFAAVLWSALAGVACVA